MRKEAQERDVSGLILRLQALRQFNRIDFLRMQIADNQRWRPLLNDLRHAIRTPRESNCHTDLFCRTANLRGKENVVNYCDNVSGHMIIRAARRTRCADYQVRAIGPERVSTRSE